MRYFPVNDSRWEVFDYTNGDCTFHVEITNALIKTDNPEVLEHFFDTVSYGNNPYISFAVKNPLVKIEDLINSCVRLTQEYNQNIRHYKYLLDIEYVFNELGREKLNAYMQEAYSVDVTRMSYSMIADMLQIDVHAENQEYHRKYKNA
jgi:hypothetical protein